MDIGNVEGKSRDEYRDGIKGTIDTIENEKILYYFYCLIPKLLKAWAGC